MVFDEIVKHNLDLHLKNLRKLKLRKKSKRIKLRKVLQLVGLRKRVLVKWRFNFFWGLHRIVKKHFIFLRKKKMFPFLLKLRNNSIFKKIIYSSFAKVPFNVFFLVQSKYDYFRLKYELNFSLRTAFNFKFISLKKKSICQIFFKNTYKNQISKVLNGSLIVLQISDLFSVIENIDLFTQESSKCLGILFYDRIISFNYLSVLVVSLLKNFKWMSLFYFNTIRFFFNKVKFLIENWVSFFNKTCAAEYTKCQLSLNLL